MDKQLVENLGELTSAQILDMALAALEDVPLGLEWTMPELFRGYVWKQLQPSSRRTAGMLFKEAMEKRNDIKMLSEKNHVQRYKKISEIERPMTPFTKKHRS